MARFIYFSFRRRLLDRVYQQACSEGWGSEFESSWLWNVNPTFLFAIIKQP